MIRWSWADATRRQWLKRWIASTRRKLAGYVTGVAPCRARRSPRQSLRLQGRFATTIRDALQRIGCDFPETVSGDTAQPYMSMMQDVACNVALGTWYYFIFATGSGGGSPVWVYQYCQGEGVAGDLRLGMLSHLCGADAAKLVGRVTSVVPPHGS